MTQGTVLCVSFPWLFFCSREGRSPPGWCFPLGNWLILPENSASRATQRTVPCAAKEDAEAEADESDS